jgi:hypothetical protein
LKSAAGVGASLKAGLRVREEASVSAVESVPGIDFERLAPWFSEHVAPVGDLSATIIGHGNLCAPPIEIGGMRLEPA